MRSDVESITNKTTIFRHVEFSEKGADDAPPIYSASVGNFDGDIVAASKHLAQFLEDAQKVVAELSEYVRDIEYCYDESQDQVLITVDFGTFDVHNALFK
jgi:hypothetical protein